MCKWIALLLGFGLIGTASWADAPRPAAQLHGLVKDALGRPLADVQLELHATGGRLIARTKTDSRGQFAFVAVALGVYTVTARRSNFDFANIVIELTRQKNTVEIYLRALQPLNMQLTTQRLDHERNGLSPETGGSVYRFTARTISELPEGDNTSLPKVLLQAPGVTPDISENGGFHVRGVDGQIQYRINGVMVPDLNSAVTPVFNSRFAQSIALLDGTLPAEFGYRTAGVIDIHTKSGCMDNTSHLSMYGGQRSTYQPSFEVGGCRHNWNYYLTGQFLQNERGVEPPTRGPQANHDFTQQAQGFAYLSRLLTPTTRLSVMSGLSIGTFQIPTNPELVQKYQLQGTTYYPPSAIHENQLDQTYYGILALQGSLNAATYYQLAGFSRYFRTNFSPDPVGDLIYQGAATRIDNSSLANGAQGDLTYHLNAVHTMRTGFYFDEEQPEDDSTTAVFLINPDGSQHLPYLPQQIVDNSNRLTFLGGVYLQDEWRPTERLDVDYGLRWDIAEAFVSDNEVQPRIGAVYRVTDATALHAGYAHYFTPPPLEQITQRTIEKFNGTSIAASDSGNENIKPQQDDYFDAGVSMQMSPGVRIGIDNYFDLVHQWLDQAQLSNSLIFSPLNYRNGRSWGVELSSSYNTSNFDGWFNFSYAVAQVNYISSMQFLVESDELAHIDHHFIPVDQTQLFTLTFGAAYRWRDWLFSFDANWNRGLPFGFVNEQTLPSYLQANLAVVREIVLPHIGKATCRVSIINIFDRVYMIRGSDVDVNTDSYGPRRAAYLGVTLPLELGRSFTAASGP